MRTIAFYNLKGGVGKTAAAVNVAYLAAGAGLRTLFWDLDTQGAATWYLGLDQGLDVKAKKVLKGKAPLGRQVHRTAYPGLDVIPADLSYRNMDLLIAKAGDDASLLGELLKPFGETHSLAVLDCPPSFSRVSENVFSAADSIFMPLIPTPLSLRAFDQLRAHLGKGKAGMKKVYPFFSMVDRRRKLHREWLDLPPASLTNLLPVYIPYSSQVEQMGAHRAPLSEFAPRSPAGRAYVELWRAVKARTKGL